MTIPSFRLIPSLRELLFEVGTAVGAAEEYKRAYAHRDGTPVRQTAAQHAASGIPL